MFRILTICLAFLIVGSATLEVAAQYRYNPSRNGGRRYCYNPNCRMCNQIWGPMQGYRLTSDYRSVRITNNTPRTTIPQTVTPRYGAAPAQPRITTKEEADTALLPTPRNAVVAALKLVKPDEDDWVYDLGCGDGRILIEAAKTYGSKCIGIEINPDSVRIARRAVSDAGLTGRIMIEEGDILKYTYERASIITLYLYPDLIKKVVPLVEPGTTVISISHDIPGVRTNKRIIEVDGVDYEFFIWHKR